MEWDDSIEEAKDNLGIYGYTKNFDEVVNEAKNLLSSDAVMKHLLYLKSNEWKIKRKKVLERDNYICQDCLEVIKEVAKLFKKVYTKKVDYNKRASQVHHLDYSYKQTDLEEEYCISLCTICHQLKHAKTTVHIKVLKKKLMDNVFIGIYLWLLKQPEFIKEAKKQHDDFIKSLTVKPNEWLNKEVKKDERINR